ncbi:hypothetical protein MO867_10815 [Microbulbifer sp. OS29]|uniref:PilY1 beta-propeller domain-containing protein n=1 Tax=Microbulbifer okhotskensis TaxID=2926617 RepID=A0A9X2EM77_9GAMM|nr:PilC/PilY family type IV pilus protein [Microbulbifer okhotskensis]MCO1334832.1 hypothetical protein [Microbulbifer okhotskensis]
MFVLDSSGSMQSMLYPPEGYSDSIDHGLSCSLEVGRYDRVEIAVNKTTGSVLFRLEETGRGGSTSSWKTWNTTSNCFKDTEKIDVYLYAESSGGDGYYYSSNNDHLVEDVSGHFLNWFFSTQGTPGSYVADHFLEEDGTTVRRTKLGVERRTDGMKTAANSLIADLSDVRIGLMQFNGSNGAKLLTGLTDLTDDSTAEATKVSLTTKVDAISASGYTPLAESFTAVGRYFVSGYSDALLTYDTQLEDDDGDPDTEEVETPLQATANSIFAGAAGGSSTTTILNWGGIDEPSAASSPIQYYCQQNFMVALTDGKPTRDDSVSSILVGFDEDCNGNPGGCTDDPDEMKEMDDVIKALYDIDLRPDMKDLNGDPVHNNITSYIVGFANDGLSDSDLMKNAGALGGGGVYTADNAGQLTDTFNTIMKRVRSITGSSGAISFNSTSLQADTLLFNAKFNSGQWRGYLSAWALSEDGTALASDETWEASELLDARTDIDDRLIITYDNGGVVFTAAAVGGSGTLHNGDLAISSTVSGGTADDKVAERIAYLRGDRSAEGEDNDSFRERGSRLGDIVNSSPIYVSEPNEAWSNASFPGHESYETFISEKASRTPMVYVGANDGLLHGFNASSTGANKGQEVIAYLPSAVLSSTAGEGLHALTSQDYDHEFYTDGTPTVRDAYIDNQWKSILVGGLGAGGKGYFALDVTDPSSFSADKAGDIVLWEFTQANDLGFTFSRPQIGRLPNGEWAAIFGNGYNSNSGDAGLFIVYLDGNDGSDNAYKYISTGTASLADPNGLSSPAIVDENKDGTIDRIFAGDLKGNMWAFDVSASSSSDWGVAGEGAPLFTAAGKAITVAPEVARNGESTGLVVAFGTGQYIVASDTTDLNAGSFYVVADNGKYSLSESDLEVRSLTLDETGEVPIRTVDGNEFNWSSKSGWYMPLQTGSGTDGGERVVSRASVQGSKIYFNTIIPSGQICAAGGSGWLMSTNLFTGLVGDDPGLDGNRNGEIDDDDAGTAGVYIAGKMPGQSGFIGDGQWIPMSDGTPIYEVGDTSGAGRLGRLSWEEMVPN